MKKYYILLITLLALHGIRAQSCLPQGITFTTQTQINNFQADYPGCTQIEGDVTIYGYYIINLNGLSVLTTIGGNLWIVGNGALTSLTGLNNLTYIGGYLHINSNEALTSLTGLNGLTYVGGNLWIAGNNALTSLTGLNGLTYIGGSFWINTNDVLTSLTGLNNLTSIGKYMQINSNENLTSLTGLNGLTSIGEYLWIGGNYVLTSLTGLNGLTSIGGYLDISYNDALTSLTGLNNLTSISGSIEIIYNKTLTSLTGLDNIDAGSINSLFISNNSYLSECSVQSICDYLTSPNGNIDIHSNATGCNNTPEVGDSCGISLPCLPFGNYYFFSQAEIDSFPSDYPNCIELEGEVTISGNDITNLNGLSVVTSIGGDLEIFENTSLTSFTGMNNLTSVGGNLKIHNNDTLTSLTGMNNLTSIGGSLLIYENYALTSLTGLEGLTSIGKILKIYNNDTLTSLTGMNNLTSIGGSLSIYANYALTSLTSLSNVTSIGGSLEILGNPALTSLTGLDNIDAGSMTELLIYNDIALSTCEVQSICDYLDNPGGYYEIWGNTTGCDSPEEVEDACAAIRLESLPNELSLTIYPTPASTQIIIETSAIKNKNQLSIMNLNGQEIIKRNITQPKTQIDISKLPSGIYFVRLTGEKTVELGKFIKQ